VEYSLHRTPSSNLSHPLDISGLGGIMRCGAEKINEDTQKRLNKPLTFLYCCGIIVPENERGFRANEMT